MSKMKLTEEELITLCSTVLNAVQEVKKEPNKIHDISVSVGLTKMPVLECAAIWLAVPDKDIRMVICDTHLAFGSRRPNSTKLISNGGDDGDYIMINYACLHGEDDMFSYRMMHPCGFLTLNGIKAIVSMYTELKKDIAVKENTSTAEALRGTMFDINYSMYDVVQ